jgi:tetratricopeptide (TPR) repeat protein
MYLSGIFYNNGIKILDGNLNITKPQVNTALSYFNNSSLLFPFNYNTYNEKGISYEYLKEYSNAISNFKTSLSINTYNPNTNYELGKAYYFSSKYKKSLLYFKDAYNFNKLYSPEYDLSLGEYYIFRHQKNKAIKVYKESLKSFPLKNKLYEKYSQIFNNNGFNSNLSSIYSDLYSITKNKYYYNLYKKLSPLQIKNNSKVTTKVKTPVKK